MTSERLLFFLNQTPFVPFAIHVADGSQFEIKSPEFVTVLVVRTRNNREGVRTIEVQDPETRRSEIIDLMLVTRLSTAADPG